MSSSRNETAATTMALSSTKTMPKKMSTTEFRQTMKDTWLTAESTFPVVNPYGNMIDMDTLLEIREKARAPQRLIMQKIRDGEIPPPNDRLKYNLTGEIPERWPWTLNRVQSSNVNNKAVNDMLEPIIHRFVKNIQNKTTDMPYKAYVANGFDTYVDENRFHEEVEYMKTNYLFAGVGSDCTIDSSKEVEMMGKRILLTRDSNNNGTFQAIDKVSNTKLPSAEIAGILFLVTHPQAGLDYEGELKENIMNSKLRKEFETYNLQNNYAAVTQDMVIKSNWKLPIDTFGEAYHFTTLHPILSEQLVANTIVFRGFDDNHGKPQHSCMTLGQNTLQVIADGHVPEDRWLEPMAMSHVSMTYVLAPNTSFIVTSSGIQATQVWPGEKVDECVVRVTLYQGHLPENDEERAGIVTGFGGFIDVVCTEDFPILYNMQRSFSESKHAETIFGKHEPALIYRHGMFNTLVKGGKQAKL